MDVCSQTCCTQSEMTSNINSRVCVFVVCFYEAVGNHVLAVLTALRAQLPFVRKNASNNAANCQNPSWAKGKEGKRKSEGKRRCAQNTLLFTLKQWQLTSLHLSLLTTSKNDVMLWRDDSTRHVSLVRTHTPRSMLLPSCAQRRRCLVFEQIQRKSRNSWEWC